MSGATVPYHLRSNKFVERQLFMDSLDYVRVWNGPKSYVYASMGGQFLEDFKMVNDRFAIEKMISIEKNEAAYFRQEFNRLGFIQCLPISSTDFVNDFDRIRDKNGDRSFIVWLDYTEANKRGKQLGEFQQLLSKLYPGDVAKITLNANPFSYRERSEPLREKDFQRYLQDSDSETYSDYETYLDSILGEGGSETLAHRLLHLTDDEHQSICVNNLKEQLDGFCDAEEIDASILVPDEFATFLLKCINFTSIKAMESSSFSCIPLASFRYKDAEHQMMTATIVLTDDDLQARIRQDDIFAAWPMRNDGWNTIHEIRVPQLSIKERHFINNLLNEETDVEKIHANLPFLLDSNIDKSLKYLISYIENYRRYPSFSRVDS